MTAPLAVDPLAASLIEFIAQEVVVGVRFGLDEPLFGQGGVDSFGFMHLMAHVESQYGVAADLRTMGIDEIGTARQLAAWIASARRGALSA